MKLQRTSRDFEGLKSLIKELRGGAKSVNGKSHLVNWFNHLVEVKRAIELNPALAEWCSWEELQGILALQDAAEESKKKKVCPRCKSETDGPFDCHKCGMRLVA